MREIAEALAAKRRSRFRPWWAVLLIERAMRNVVTKTWRAMGGRRYYVQRYEKGTWEAWELPRSVFSVGIWPGQRTDPQVAQEFGSEEEEMGYLAKDRELDEITLEDVERAGYVTNEGIVRQPGEFEGCPWWVLPAWEMVLDGTWEGAFQPLTIDGGALDFVELTEELRTAWELDDESVAVALWKDDQGFVHWSVCRPQDVARYESVADRQAEEEE